MNKKNVTTIYVVRHAESEMNLCLDSQSEITKVYDELGSPLTNNGKTQSAKIAQKLKHVPFEAIFSSDLRRARETAEIIASIHGLPVNVNTTIRERYFGKNFASVTNEKRQELEKILTNLNDEEKLLYKYLPDGESGLDGVKRFKTFVRNIVPKYRSKSIFVVTHGNIMRSFLVHIGYMKYNDLPARSLQNTSYFVLETDGETYKIIEAHGLRKGDALYDQ